MGGVGHGIQCVIFPFSKMMTIRDSIQFFKCMNRDPLHKARLRFKKLVLQCPTHGLPNNVLLQYFYQSLDLVNKGITGSHLED